MGYEELGVCNFNHAYQYLGRAVELMDESEFATHRSELIEKISDSIINLTLDDEIESGEPLGLMLWADYRERDEECFFGIEIVDRISDAVGTMIPDNVPWVYMEYCNLLNSIIATVIDPRVMLYAACCATLFLDIEPEAVRRITSSDFNSDVIEANGYFYDRLVNKLDRKIRKTPEEEIDRIIYFWAESGRLTYSVHLYNASTYSMRMFGKGMLTRRRLKKEAKREVDAFVNNLFGCIVEEIPE